jgi:hypothetical protein
MQIIFVLILLIVSTFVWYTCEHLRVASTKFNKIVIINTFSLKLYIPERNVSTFVNLYTIS